MTGQSPRSSTRMARLILGTALLLGVPAASSAQVYLTPYIGANVGGSTGDALVPSATKDASRLTYGATGGWTLGWLGVEADVAYSHRFFDHDGAFIETSSLWTVMGNGRVAIPWLAMGKSVQPYASAGLGVIRPNIVEVLGLAKAGGSKFGWNAGAGATGFFTEHTGIQGDIRYFRARDDEDSTNPFGIDFNGLDFWRASIGVAFKW